MRQPRAILFDLDDTLVDRDRSIASFAPTLREAFSSALGDIAPDDLVRAVWTADGFGYRARGEVIADLLAELPWRDTPGATALQAHWDHWFPRSTVGTVGLHEVLCDLRERGVRLGIITNGGVDRQHAKIDHLELRHYFDTIVVSEGVDLRKPDQRIFHLALANLDISPDQAWFVGDHPVNDVLGAAAAGLTAVWFRRNHRWPADHDAPVLTIASFADILPALDGLIVAS